LPCYDGEVSCFLSLLRIKSIKLQIKRLSGEKRERGKEKPIAQTMMIRYRVVK